MISALVEALIRAATLKYASERLAGKMVHLVVLEEERIVLRAAVEMGLVSRRGPFGARSW